MTAPGPAEDESAPLPPPAPAPPVFGEEVRYESDEARDHWDDRIWRR